jgi:PAS domain S-box-containing protein
VRVDAVSIRSRLILSQLAVVFAVLVLFSIFRVLNDARTYRESVSAKLDSMARIVGHNCTSALDFLDPVDAGKTLAALESERRVSHAWILDAQGRVFAAYRRAGLSPETPVVSGRDGREVVGGRLTASYPILRGGEAIGFVVLRYDLDRFWTILLRQYPSALLALGGGMGIALLLALRTQRTISAPILELVSAARGVVRSLDFSARVPEERRDEIGVLYRGFNAMMAEMQVREAERDRALAGLRESEQKYRELVMLANSIILRWSRDGRITFLNEFGQRFFGYAESEILGRHVVGTIVPETESTGRDLRPLLSQMSAEPERFERSVNENVRRNGERVWIAWTNRVVHDERGEVTEILSIGSDITGRKRLEEEVLRLHEDLKRHAGELEKRVRERTAELAVAKERAESADRLKSAFLATMSHELRTPLNSIIGFTGLLLQGLAGPLNAEQAKQLGMVRESGRHLLALINDVLDISKIEAGQIEIASAPFDLRESIRKVIQSVAPLAESKRLALVAEISPEVGPITSDRRRVEQVLLNLLSNAIKFTERGQVRVVSGTAAGAVRISVADTGVGIRPEDMGKLFQPFRQLDTGLTRQHEGTGLGLAICRRLVERLGGTISVESEAGKGSTFSFTLPQRGVEAPWAGRS